jgi:hypothetical protein
MPNAVIDHLVVTAPSLRAGSQWIHSLLGVAPTTGGSHPRMGTHNMLMKLGPDTYLEVIAIDPQAQAPAQPRWFQLDNPVAAGSRFATWVMRVNDIHQAAKLSALPHGIIQPMSRGTLNWRISVPEDGCLQGNGTIPPLIQWDALPYPASRLPESHCTLTELQIHCPEPAELMQSLQSVGFQGPVTIHKSQAGEAPSLLALIATPNGVRTLDSRLIWNDSPN